MTYQEQVAKLNGQIAAKRDELSTAERRGGCHTAQEWELVELTQEIEGLEAKKAKLEAGQKEREAAKAELNAIIGGVSAPATEQAKEKELA